MIALKVLPKRGLEQAMGGLGISTGATSSSSGEEDGDADWRAAIDSVAATISGFSSAANCLSTSDSTTQGVSHSTPNEEDDSHKPQKLKHYQIKAQKLLDDILEKTIEVVRDPAHGPDNDPVTNEGGIRLFKHAPPGIVFDHVDEYQGPRKRPRILPGKEIDEKSKKFRQQLQSVAIDGLDIMAAATDACQKSLARLETKDAEAKAAAKREEERVAELKRIRGERWLPSIAKEKQVEASRKKFLTQR